MGLRRRKANQRIVHGAVEEENYLSGSITKSAKLAFRDEKVAIFARSVLAVLGLGVLAWFLLRVVHKSLDGEQKVQGNQK